MSGHIQDLWYSPGPRGGKDRPTSRHGHGLRWKARYIDPDGKERSKSFARKVDAERFLTEVGHSMIAGSYLDPDAGRVTLRSRVPLWLDSLTCDPTTRHHIAGRITRHILRSTLADKRLDVLSRSPSLIQSWVAGLPVGAAYAQQILTDLSSIMDAAVADGLIPRNPCKAAIIRPPRVVKRKLVPWSRERVATVRRELPDRYRAMVDACAGLGLRQGEAFGLSLEEIDWLKRVVHVRQQVKLYRAITPVYGPPKGGKPRMVPLPRQVSEALAAHLEAFPARAVRLPWQTPDGNPVTASLLFTTTDGKPVNRSAFNRDSWVPARRAAGIPDGEDAEAAGMHQLRHHYASVLLSDGIDVKRVQSWLGHHSAAFTLDVYGHLMPEDEERSLRQIEAAIDGPQTVRSIASHATEA